MRKELLIALCVLIFTSCSKDEVVEDSESLKAQFQGKYELISAESEIPVDMNMDGVSSTDLFKENAQLSEAGIMIRILDPKYEYHFFEEKWPMVSSQVSRDEVFDPNKEYSADALGYDTYFNLGLFVFNADHTEIHLLEDPEKNSVNTLLSFESVMVDGNEEIEVITHRNLYTRKGWIATKIVSKYRRYTQIL